MGSQIQGLGLTNPDPKRWIQLVYCTKDLQGLVRVENLEDLRIEPFESTGVAVQNLLTSGFLVTILFKMNQHFYESIIQALQS